MENIPEDDKNPIK